MKQQYGQTPTLPKPFVKWAGGKRQLVPTLAENLPKSFGTYFEPFIGGGALFFYILTRQNKQRCNISDLNSDLITTYITIRDKVDELVSSLKNHEKHYQKDPKTYYYAIRQNNPKDSIERASKLLFLNRTCFNGLYRVNSKGMFNVPLGSYTKPKIVNEENLRAVNNILQSQDISIRYRDFADILDDVRKNDLVYFDPPYQPISATASFTSYTSNDFTTNDLDRLYVLCQKLDSKGCKVMLSNSDSEKVFEMFSHKPWKICKVSAMRAINSDSKKRSGHFELIIKNY